MFDPSRLYSSNQRSSHSGQILRKKPMKTSGALSNDTVQAVIKVLRHQGWTVQYGPIIHPKPPPCPIPLPITFPYRITGNYTISVSDTFIDNVSTAQQIILRANDTVGPEWNDIRTQITDFNFQTPNIVPDSGVVNYGVLYFSQHTQQNQESANKPYVLFTFHGSNMTVNTAQQLNVPGNTDYGTVIVWVPDANYHFLGVINLSYPIQTIPCIDANISNYLSLYSDNTNLYENILASGNPSAVTLGSLEYQALNVDKSCTLFFDGLVEFEMILQCHYEIQYE